MAASLPSPAFATDGVIEISQIRATQTGCHATDAPGFPISIDTPGSYVLTSPLEVTDPNTDALFVSTTPITIDLNGFEIRGPVVCSGFSNTLSCSPGSGLGIRAIAQPRITVRNGAITGFGGGGLLVASRSLVEGVVVERNGGNGIEVFGDSVVTRCRADRNGLGGIRGDQSTADENFGTGIAVGDGGIVRASTSRRKRATGMGNDNTGIFIGNGSSVVQCSAISNGPHGIATSSNAMVLESTSRSNGFHGISASFDSRVHGNVVGENVETGIHMVSGVGFSDNIVTILPTSPATVSGGTDLGGNTCNRSTTCP